MQHHFYFNYINFFKTKKNEGISACIAYNFKGKIYIMNYSVKSKYPKF